MNTETRIKCACGCGRTIKYPGKGQMPKYYSNACRQRDYRRRLMKELHDLRKLKPA